MQKQSERGRPLPLRRFVGSGLKFKKNGRNRYAVPAMEKNAFRAWFS